MSRILVLGNAAVDLVFSLPQLPRRGETAVATALARAPGGKGLNQATAAARAGARVLFRAPVGRDADAALIAAALADEPFADVRLIPLDPPTDLSIVMVSADGENSIVSLCGCADALSPTEALGFANLADAGDWLLLQGNLSSAATLAAAETAASRGAHVAINLAPLRWPAAALVARGTLVIANQGETAELTRSADTLGAAARLRGLGAATAIVTLGAAGCVCADADGVHGVDAPAAIAIDTTGAGDIFCGVLVARLAAGQAMRQAIDAAQAAAALSVGRRGAFTSIPSRDEMAFPAPRPALPIQTGVT